MPKGLLDFAQKTTEKNPQSSTSSDSSLPKGATRAKDEMKAMKLLHKTVKKVGEDIVEYKFNTAISSLMILLGG